MSRNGQLTAENATALMEAVARRRDRRAFIGLFEYFGPRIHGYLRRRGVEPAVAEDLVQDVLLTVWRQAPRFDPARAAVSTWVFTIARNRMIDSLRRSGRPAPDPADPVLVREPEETADQKLAGAQQEASLRAAVRHLPDNQAELLKLAFYEDKSHRAIAAELDLPLGTVKSRLRLAMGKLRAELETPE